MTGMYNVLEKLRAGETLSKKEQTIHEQGLVSVLRQIHDDLDAAVADAYGWPHDLSDEEILERLVALNHERAAEEARGHIRWLRPEFQNPHRAESQAGRMKQGELPGVSRSGSRETSDGDAEESELSRVSLPAKAKVEKHPWPKTLPERIQLVRTVLSGLGTPASAADVAKLIKGARKPAIEELLETLVTVGQALRTDDGRYRA